MKAGVFGFCTCEMTHGVCHGCYRVPTACTCSAIEVDPEETVNTAYKRLESRLKKPLMPSKAKSF